MKLLLVSTKTEHSKGGIAVWTDSFLEKCAEYGIDCDLLNIATIGKRAKQGNARRNFKDEFLRTRAIFKNLRAMLKNQSYDVAHVNTSCGTFGLIRDYLTILKIKKKQPSCKRIIHFHCDIQQQCGSKIGQHFLLKILKATNQALVLNQRNYNYLYQTFGVSSAVVANFIASTMVRVDIKVIEPEVKDALFVGYVRPEKGIRELYDLAQKFPQTNFRLIGEIHREVMTWDKPDNIILCGKKNRSEILSEMDKADIFIFLSHSEGFSIALLESMARGLPCLATDVGANAEMLENKGGIVVARQDSLAAIAAFERLQSPKTREEMSRWSLEKVRSSYTLEKVMEQIVGFYK